MRPTLERRTPAKWCWLPMPDDPNVSLPGCCFSYATNPARSLNGSAGFASRTNVESAMSVIGTSFSDGAFGDSPLSSGVMTSGPSDASNSVCVFAITVCCLVEVHKVHINRCPRQ